MRIIFFTLLLGYINLQTDQEKSIEKWLQEIVNEMIEMNDLRKYSNEKIPSDIKVDLLMVESVKDIKIDNGIISMLVNHGAGKYCTKLKFKYIEKKEVFYLVFGKIKTKILLGKEQKFITPWSDRVNNCK